MKYVINIIAFIISFFLVNAVFYYFQDINWTTKAVVKTLVSSVLSGLIISFFKIVKGQPTNKEMFGQALVFGIFLATALQIIQLI